MRGSILTIIEMLILFSSLNAQKEDYIWVGGRDLQGANEIKNGPIIDFNRKSTSFEKGVIGYNFHSYSTSICDEEGQLLFYTNGCAVLNPDASILENGDSLNYNEWFEEIWQGDCNNGYPGAQSAIVLPSLAQESMYYLIGQIRIYKSFSEPPGFELHYTLVDTENDKVIEKNIPLFDSIDIASYYLTAIANADNDGYYILQPKVEDSLALVYELTSEGFLRLEDQNLSHFFTGYRSSSSGTARFSPDGTKYAFYNYYDGLHIYDFDRATGEISNHKAVTIHDDIDIEDIRFGSVEWSSDSRFIYTASSLELHQVDTWETDLQEGVRLIDIYNGMVDPFPTPFFLMALAPDCKIYMAATNGSYSYHVINSPNELGTACNFVQNGIQLPPGTVGTPSFPNHPRWRVDEEDKCDPTISSIFGESVYYRSELLVYPIPSTGLYTVEIPEQKAGVVHVMSIQGEVLRSYDVSSSDKTATVDITDMPSGYYHIEYYPIKNKDRKVYTQQVVKVQ